MAKPILELFTGHHLFKSLFMRKSYFFAAILFAGMFVFTSVSTHAQSTYKTGLGLGIDFGNGSTLVGPSVKHFFSTNNAGQFEALFGNGYTILQAAYLYHKHIPNAAGLQWYLGAGAGVGLYDGGSNFLIRPAGGLDYKITNVPLSFSFDWRPTITIGNGDSDFEPARFGLGFRYALN